MNTVERNFKTIEETVTNDNISKRDLAQLLKEIVCKNVSKRKERKQNKRRSHSSNST